MLNQDCSCGSGVKFKKCYLLEDKKCKMFQKHEHEKREKTVVNFLIETAQEINNASGKNIDGNPIVSQRARLALVFILVDILAQYWDKYLGLDNSQKLYFPNWVARFCVNDQNEEFKKNIYLKRWNENDFYKFRNSILHFYGVPRLSEGIAYILVPDSDSLKKYSGELFPEKFLDNLSVSMKQEHRIIQVESFKKLVWTGAIEMIKEMKSRMQINPELHIVGIERIYKEVKERSVAIIDMEKPN